MNKEYLLYELFESSIAELKAIEELVSIYEMQDDQKYLDWKDKLNKLSVDSDR